MSGFGSYRFVARAIDREGVDPNDHSQHNPKANDYVPMMRFDAIEGFSNDHCDYSEGSYQEGDSLSFSFSVQKEIDDFLADCRRVLLKVLTIAVNDHGVDTTDELYRFRPCLDRYEALSIIKRVLRFSAFTSRPTYYNAVLPEQSYVDHAVDSRFGWSNFDTKYHFCVVTPGSRSTSALIDRVSSMSADDVVVLTATRSACLEISERLPDYRVFTCDGFIMHRSYLSSKYVVVDGCMRMHFGKVAFCATLLESRICYLYSDLSKVPFLENRLKRVFDSGIVTESICRITENITVPERPVDIASLGKLSPLTVVIPRVVIPFFDKLIDREPPLHLSLIPFFDKLAALDRVAPSMFRVVTSNSFRQLTGSFTLGDGIGYGLPILKSGADGSLEIDNYFDAHILRLMDLYLNRGNHENNTFNYNYHDRLLTLSASGNRSNFRDAISESYYRKLIDFTSSENFSPRYTRVLTFQSYYDKVLNAYEYSPDTSGYVPIEATSSTMNIDVTAEYAALELYYYGKLLELYNSDNVYLDCMAISKLYVKVLMAVFKRDRNALRFVPIGYVSDKLNDILEVITNLCIDLRPEASGATVEQIHSWL
nr:helicase [Blunervirus sp.]